MFFSTILKTSLIFIIKRNIKPNYGTFFLWISNDYSMIYDNFGGIKYLLKQNLALQFCRNRNMDAIILTENHIYLDRIHHIRNNWLGVFFFYPGDSHTNRTVSLPCFIWVLKVPLRLTLIQKGGLCPLRLLLLMREFSVLMPWA